MTGVIEVSDGAIGASAADGESDGSHADVRPESFTGREEFAAGLTALRERAGLSVRELSRRLDVPSATLGGYFSGRHLPTVSQIPKLMQLLGECGVTDDAAVDAWVAALGRVRAAAGRRIRSAQPYRGLQPFGPDDAHLFFGRDDETTDILIRLRTLAEEPGPSGGVLAVLGPSGSGKSSLLRAGLVAGIRTGRLDDPQTRWTCEVMTPGRNPVTELATTLARVDGARHVLVIDQFEEVFTQSDAHDRATFLRALSDRSPDVLVVIGLRADFYAAAATEPVLIAALQHDQVLVGPLTLERVRDVILRPAERSGVDVAPGLVDLVLADLAPHDAAGSAHDAGALPLLSHALLSTWERSDGRQLTIADYRASGGIDTAVQRTADELFTSLDPDAQDLARRLFVRLVNIDDDVAVTRRRAGRDELSRLTGADGTSADRLVDAFVERRLLTAHANAVEISHEALLSAWPRLRAWIDADRAGLRAHRRITESATQWSAAAEDDALLLRGVRLDAAADWASEPGHRGELDPVEQRFLDASIDRAASERTRERRRSRRLRRLLAVVGVLALVAGVLAVLALRARSDANRQRSVALTTRDDALSRQVSFQSRELAAHDPALAEQLALIAYRIAPTAEARGTLVDRSALSPITRVLGVQGPTPLAVSAEGSVIAVGHAQDGSVHLYRRADGAAPAPLGVVPGPGEPDQPYAVAFGPDARTVAVGGSDGQLRLWNIATPSSPVLLDTLHPGFTGAIESIAISPDGQTLAAGSSGPTPLKEWDLTTPAAAARLPAPRGLPVASTVQSVVFSPDGSRLAAGGGGGDGPAGAASFVAHWPAARPGTAAATLDPATTVTAAASAVTNSIAYAPDGRTLYAGVSGGSVLVLDADSLLPTHPALTGVTSAKINTVAVSPDGSRVAAGTGDDYTEQWSTSDFAKLGTTANPGPVTGVAYSAGTDPQLLSTAADGGLRLAPLTSPMPSVGTVFNLAYSADSSRMAVFSGPDTPGVQLWDTSDVDHPEPIGPHFGALASAGTNGGAGALNPAGTVIAVGTRTGMCDLYDVSSPQIRPATEPFQCLTKGTLVEAFAFSPDGKLLVVGGDDHTVRILDVHDPAHPVQLSSMSSGDEVLGVAFSPNGRLVAAADVDKHVYLWNVADPAEPQRVAELGGFTNYVYTVAFSPDGTLLAAGSSDDTARVWRVPATGSPRPDGRPLLGATDYVFGVAFSPDSHTLATSSDDGAVRLYPVLGGTPARLPTSTLDDVGAAAFSVVYRPDGTRLSAAGRGDQVAQWTTTPSAYARSLCPLLGTPITHDEWALYVPGAPYDPPCS